MIKERIEQRKKLGSNAVDIGLSQFHGEFWSCDDPLELPHIEGKGSESLYILPYRALGSGCKHGGGCRGQCPGRGSVQSQEPPACPDMGVSTSNRKPPTARGNHEL